MEINNRRKIYRGNDIIHFFSKHLFILLSHFGHARWRATSQFPDQRSNRCIGSTGSLTTGLSGKSQEVILYIELTHQMENVMHEEMHSPRFIVMNFQKSVKHPKSRKAYLQSSSHKSPNKLVPGSSACYKSSPRLLVNCHWRGRDQIKTFQKCKYLEYLWLTISILKVTLKDMLQQNEN